MQHWLWYKPKWQHLNKIKMNLCLVTQLIYRNWFVQILQVQWYDLCKGIEMSQVLYNSLDLRIRTQIGLCEQQTVTEGHLLRRFVDATLCPHFAQLGHQVFGITDSQDRIQAIVLLHEGIQEEGRSNGWRVSQTSCLNQYAIEVTASLTHIFQNFLHSFDKISAQSATNTWSAVEPLLCQLTNHSKVIGENDKNINQTTNQMHPLFISTTVSVVRSACSTRVESIPTSPNSFSITARRFPCCSRKIRFNKVVLPLPRKPVITVTGTFAFSRWMRSSSFSSFFKRKRWSASSMPKTGNEIGQPSSECNFLPGSWLGHCSRTKKNWNLRNWQKRLGPKMGSLAQAPYALAFSRSSWWTQKDTDHLWPLPVTLMRCHLPVEVGHHLFQINSTKCCTNLYGVSEMRGGGKPPK